MNFKSFLKYLESAESINSEYEDFENLITQPVLHNKLKHIARLGAEGLYDDAYAEEYQLLALILHKYINPEKNEFWFIDSVEYYYKNSQPEIARRIISINGQFNLVEKPDETDAMYLLFSIADLYNKLLKAYGKKDISDDDKANMKIIKFEI